MVGSGGPGGVVAEGEKEKQIMAKHGKGEKKGGKHGGKKGK